MPKKRGVVDVYFRFLNLAQSVRALPGPRLDLTEERLLQALTAAWHGGHALTVTEAMALSEAGAPATIHRRLKVLIDRGLVTLDESTEDLRIKTVVPTKKALDYFEKLASCFEDARRSVLN